MSTLLALALLLQETPVEVFQKLEKAIESARTLKVEFTVDSPINTDAAVSKGFFSIEEGGRAKLRIELRSNEKASIGVSMDCDGTKIVSTIDRNTIEAAYDPKIGRSNFNMYLARLGVFSGHFFQHGFWTGSSARGREAMTLDLKQVFQVQNLEFGGQGKGGIRSLTYDIKTAFNPSPLDKAKIWYDPKTYTLVRREYELKDKATAVTIYEDYTDVKLGDEAAAPTATGGKAKPPPPPPIPDSELDTLFFKAKLQVAESHLKSGKKDKAIETLEDAIKTYPKHSLVPEARRQLEEARKK